MFLRPGTRSDFVAAKLVGFEVFRGEAVDGWADGASDVATAVVCGGMVVFAVALVDTGVDVFEVMFGTAVTGLFVIRALAVGGGAAVTSLNGCSLGAGSHLGARRVVVRFIASSGGMRCAKLLPLRTTPLYILQLASIARAPFSVAEDASKKTREQFTGSVMFEDEKLFFETTNEPLIRILVNEKEVPQSSPLWGGRLK